MGGKVVIVVLVIREGGEKRVYVKEGGVRGEVLRGRRRLGGWVRREKEWG